jgi:hypothetical protein
LHCKHNDINHSILFEQLGVFKIDVFFWISSFEFGLVTAWDLLLFAIMEPGRWILWWAILLFFEKPLRDRQLNKRLSGRG